MKPSTPTRSMWERDREGFSAFCCEYFQVNFDNAPVFIVRSEYVKVRKSGPHQLIKLAEPATQERLERGRQKARTKHTSTRLSQQAMQRSGSLIESVR